MGVVSVLITFLTASEGDIQTEVKLGEDDLKMVSYIDDHDLASDYLWDNNNVINGALNVSSATVHGDDANIDASKITLLYSS